MYLWKRRFLTPDYTGGGLTRSLDGWVAKMIKFTDARSNYFMLTELPVRLREHAEQQKAIAVEELQKLQDMEAKALQIEGIVEDRAALVAAQKSLEEIEARIEAEEKRHETLFQQRSVFSTASDEISQQAIGLQVSEIKSETLASLYMQAKMTSNPDDDVIVARIRDLQQDEKNRHCGNSGASGAGEPAPAILSGARRPPAALQAEQLRLAPFIFSKRLRAGDPARHVDVRQGLGRRRLGPHRP